MKLFKNKKGSVLVEKILMAAFAVAAGGAVVVYGTNVINNSKNTEITGILSGGGQMSQEELNSHFDDVNYAIHLTATEINSKSFSNLVSTIRQIEDFQPYNWLGSSTITAGGKTYTRDEIIVGDPTDSYIMYYCNQSPGYDIIVGECYWNAYNMQAVGITFLIEEGDELWCSIIDAQGDFTWNINNSAFYDLVKPALIADLS